MTTPAPPSTQQRVRYRYHFTDFMSGRLRATLPMRDVQLDDVLGGVGKATGSIPLLDISARRQNVAAATLPRRSCLWAERQVIDPGRRLLSTSVQWGGIIMGRSRTRAGRALALSCITWEGYLAKRLLEEDYIVTQWDKGTIFRDLLDYAVAGDRLAGSQFDPDNPWFIGSKHTAPIWNRTTTIFHNDDDGTYPQAPDATLTGVLADRTYVGTDEKPVLDAVTSLASSGDGFDWRLEPYYDTSIPGFPTFAVRARIGYPRLGRVAPPDLAWSTVKEQSRAGYLEDYTITEDESAVYNRLTALGSGQPPDQLRYTASNFDEGLFGYPPYSTALASSSTDDLTTPDSIIAHAEGALAASAATAVTVSGVKVRGDLFPYLDRYTLGDDVTLRLEDDLTNSTLTVIGKLTGRSISPPQQGRAETVALDVQGQRVVTGS